MPPKIQAAIWPTAPKVLPKKMARAIEMAVMGNPTKKQRIQRRLHSEVFCRRLGHMARHRSQRPCKDRRNPIIESAMAVTSPSSMADSVVEMAQLSLGDSRSLSGF